MHRTEVLLDSKGSTSPDKRSFDKKVSKIVIHVHKKSPTKLSLEAPRPVVPTNLSEHPPKVIIPPNEEYTIEAKSPEERKYFGFEAPLKFNEQVAWLKKRNEISEVPLLDLTTIASPGSKSPHKLAPLGSPHHKSPRKLTSRSASRGRSRERSATAERGRRKTSKTRQNSGSRPHSRETRVQSRSQSKEKSQKTPSRGVSRSLSRSSRSHSQLRAPNRSHSRSRTPDHSRHTGELTQHGTIPELDSVEHERDLVNHASHHYHSPIRHEFRGPTPEGFVRRPRQRFANSSSPLNVELDISKVTEQLGQVLANIELPSYVGPAKDFEVKQIGAEASQARQSHTMSTKRVSNKSYSRKLSAKKGHILSRQDTGPIEDMVKLEPIPGTPRSRYIEKCFKEKLNPRAYLLLRKSTTTELRLGHLGIGNDMGSCVAESFRDLPNVQLVDLSDNNFSDKALHPIIVALLENGTVTHLDISENNVGRDTAHALEAYLRSENCVLTTLIAKQADINDDVAKEFILTLIDNSTLTELDLSTNSIGLSETLNVVKREVVTGGKALARVLGREGCVLRSLKLGWNMIRVGSAVEMCKSIALNSSLTCLDLNYNAIGREGGIALGNSLHENKTLRSLCLASNALDATACLTLCAGAIENKTLRELVLDGNPICEQGAHAAMLITVMGVNHTTLSMNNCNVSSKDVNCTKINFDNLCCSYDLVLSDPYQRAVAILIMRIVASHHSYVISKCQYFDPKTMKHPEHWSISPFWSNEISEVMSEQRLALQRGLNDLLTACEDEAAAKSYFDIVDADGSGEIDRDEFGDLLTSIGIELDNEQLDNQFDNYDLDKGGTIGLLEFLVFLKRERAAAERRLQDLLHIPALCTNKVPGVRFVPPNRGRLLFTVTDGFQRKDIYRTLTGVDRKHIIAAASASPNDRVSLVLHAVSGVKLRLDDALALLREMSDNSASKVRVLSALLAQMDTTSDARILLTSTIGGNKSEALALRRILGSAIKPLTGIVNGYFNLDLSRELDRICLFRLLEASRFKEKQRVANALVGEGHIADISQKCNGNSSFRNEIFNGEPITIDEKFASPLPVSGRLSFDYSGGETISRHATVASDIRVIKSLVDCFLLSRRLLDQGLQKLHVLKTLSDKTLNGDGNTLFEVDYETSVEISDHQLSFYENIGTRDEAVESSMRKEVITVNYEAELTRRLLATFQPPPVTTRLSRSSDLDDDWFKPNPSNPTKGVTFGGLDGTVSSSSTADSRYRSKKTGLKPVSSKYADKASESSKLFQSMSAQLFASGKASVEASASQSTIQSNPILSLYEDVVDEIVGDTNILKDNGKLPGSLLRLHDGRMMHELVDSHGYPIRLKAPIVRSISAGRTDLTVVGTTASISYDSNSAASLRRDRVDFTNKFSAMILSKDVSLKSKAARMVEHIEDVFSKLYLYSRHVALLMELFSELGSIKRTEYFGSYRVDLLITLFERIVDLHNFDLILRVLSAFEIACLYCRLGWLSVFNPMKPEGSYALDLTRYEERKICKILFVLQLFEPGSNLPRFEFCWDRKTEAVCKGDFVEAWGTEHGLPRRGMVYISYYGGSGKNYGDCHPDTVLRRALLELVLLNEEDIIPDEDRVFSWEAQLGKDAFSSEPANDQRKLDRAAYISANSSLWRTYLVPAIPTGKEKLGKTNHAKSALVETAGDQGISGSAISTKELV